MAGTEQNPGLLTDIPQEFIDVLIETLSKEQTNIDSKNIKEMVNKLKSGATLKEALGVDERGCEEIYSQAYNLYRAGKYVQAAFYFRLLFIMFPEQSRLLLSMASCEQMLKQYAEAANSYETAFALYNEAPALFYAAHCHIHLNDREKSLHDLYQFIEWANKNGIGNKAKDDKEIDKMDPQQMQQHAMLVHVKMLIENLESNKDLNELKSESQFLDQEDEEELIW